MTAVMSARSVIERELRSIWDDRGRLTPGDVVDAARPEDHPLHAQFEWDDEVAGAAYRTAQAAQMIRSVKITLTSENGSAEDHRVRAWLPARYAGADDAESGQYVPTQAVESAEQREFMLRQMRREAAAFRRRFEHLAEYWQVVDGIIAARDEAAAELPA